MLSVSFDKHCLSNKTDTVELDELTKRLSATDPAVSLRAVGALHRLAERVEAGAVAQARAAGWTWEQIGDALGVTRQSVHTKHGK